MYHQEVKNGIRSRLISGSRKRMSENTQLGKFPNRAEGGETQMHLNTGACGKSCKSRIYFLPAFSAALVTLPPLAAAFSTLLMTLER